MLFFFQMTRPSGPAGQGTPSATVPPSGPWPHYPKDPPGWPSNQPDTYSSYTSGTGEWYDSSAGVPWSQPNQPTFTNQSSGAFTTPTHQFPANPTMASGFQQQGSLPGQPAPVASQSGDVMAPLQPGLATGGAYGWNNDGSAGQWQTQSQWPWPQDNSQWQQSQPFQYMVRFVTFLFWIIIVSDRRPETKQGIEGKIVRFRSGRVGDRVRDKDCRSEPDRWSEAISFGAC